MNEWSKLWVLWRIHNPQQRARISLYQTANITEQNIHEPPQFVRTSPHALHPHLSGRDEEVAGEQDDLAAVGVTELDLVDEVALEALPDAEALVAARAQDVGGVTVEGGDGAVMGRYAVQT